MIVGIVDRSGDGRECGIVLYAETIGRAAAAYGDRIDGGGIDNAGCVAQELQVVCLCDFGIELLAENGAGQVEHVWFIQPARSGHRR